MAVRGDHQAGMQMQLLVSLGGQLEAISAELSDLGRKLDAVAQLLHQVVGGQAAGMSAPRPGVTLNMGDVGIGRDMSINERGERHGGDQGPRHHGGPGHFDSR